jgi:hypothetical protein
MCQGPRGEPRRLSASSRSRETIGRCSPPSGCERRAHARFRRPSVTLAVRRPLRLSVIAGVVLFFSTLAPMQVEPGECRDDGDCPPRTHCVPAIFGKEQVFVCDLDRNMGTPVDPRPQPPKYPCKTDSDCPLSTQCGGTSCYRDASRTFFCFVDSDCFDTEVCANKQPGENAGRCYPRPDRAQQ